MGAPADHFPFMQHNDLVQRQDGGDPLGNDDGCGAAVMIPDGPAEFRVCPVVQGGGSIIQDQDFRLCRQCTGDEQPLFLAPRIAALWS